MNNLESINILCITWNTQSISFSKYLSSDIEDQEKNIQLNNDSYINMNTQYADCISIFCDKIYQLQPTIIIISFQEDAFPGSYVHSHVLPREMNLIGYSLIKRAKMQGIGATSKKTYKARGLRTSLYVKSEIARDIITYEKNHIYYNSEIYRGYADECILKLDSEKWYDSQRYEQEEYTNSIFRNKGAIAIYLSLPLIGHFVFINCHLPFFSHRLFHNIVSNDREHQKHLLKQNLMYNNIYKKFVLKRDDIGNPAQFNINRPIPEYIFLMGDLNYRIRCQISNDISSPIDFIDRMNIDINFLYEMYTLYDEYKNQRDKKLIYHMNEGINNSGPLFRPTAKMSKPRNSNDYYDNGIMRNYGGYRIGKYAQRYPSWCDRILHMILKKNCKYNINCIEYDILYKSGIMDSSDHNAIYGFYNISLK